MAEAAKKFLAIDLLEQDDSSISFQWSHGGQSCVVKRDGETIYEGSGNSLTDENLHRGELYTYTLESLDDEGEVLERLKMQTGTENHSEDITNCLQEIAVTTIVSQSKIALAWGKLEGVENYEIYRNGELMDSVRKSQYTDRTAEADEEYTYWIKAKRPLQQSETDFSEEKSLAAHLFGLLNVKSSQEEAAMEEFWLVKKIAAVGQLLSDSPQPKLENLQLKWDFRYTTFLPDEILKSPNPITFNQYFKGDNRGFDPESRHYRTQVNFSLQLTDKDAILKFNKDIGTTIAYNWRKKFRKADVASAEGIHVEKIDEDERKVTLTLTHSVGNPLTTSPNIDYDISATFYRDGHFDIVGDHDQSPNHEVYLKNESLPDWLQIHEAESKGLAWMSRSIASQYWRASNFE